MTYLQPHKNKGILNMILVGLGAALVGGVFGMVVFYNATVNLSQNIAAAKAELNAVGAQTTELQGSVIQSLSATQAAAIASRDGLVVDNNPQFFPVPRSWPIASQ